MASGIVQKISCKSEHYLIMKKKKIERNEDKSEKEYAD